MLTFEHTDNGNYPAKWPHTDADILPSIKVVARDGREIIGYAVITPERDRFTNLFINKEHRGKGYGEQFFQYIIANFTITNFSVAPYDGLENFARLVSWHEGHGFKPSGAIEMVRG